MLKITARIGALAALLALLGAPAAFSYSNDYAQDVAIDSNPSPRDVVTNLSAPQFTRNETNSRVDDYIYQDEQINLDKDAGIVRVLRTNQKVNINNFVTALIPCKNVNPRELRGMARTICRKEGGDADVLQDKAGQKYYLVVVCPDFQLPYILKTFETIDQKWVNEYTDGSWRYYYKAKNRNMRDIVRTLQVYRTPDAVWDFDDPANAVLWSDQPCIEPLFKKGLAEIDIPPSQVMLDVAIYEIDTQNDLLLGVDYVSWKNSIGRYLFEGTFWDFRSRDETGAFPGNLTLSAPDWGRFASFNFFMTSAYVDFLQAKGRARILKHTIVSAKSGTVAQVAATDKLVGFTVRTDNTTPYVTDFQVPDQTQVRYHDDNNVHFVGTLEKFHERTLNYRITGQVGVTLSALPVVGLKSAELALVLDVTEMTGNTPSGTPIIARRYLSSSVEIEDGQPLVLGGLDRNEDVKTAAGIPFLRDIPILGYAFGREVTTKRQTKLVVFITPRFSLCATSTANPPEELITSIQIAKGEKELEVPKNPFGFDQWLLDRSGKTQE